MMSMLYRTSLVAGCLVAAGLVLTACASATPEQKQEATSARVLTGAEIQQALVGNTLSGRSSKGPSYIEYYDESGQIRGLWGGRDKYTGSWKISGNEMCFDYDGSSDSDGCSGISQNGDKVFFLDEKGEPENVSNPASLSAGNSNGL